MNPQQDFAQATMNRLFKNAKNNHGLVLQPAGVRVVAGTIANMDRAIQELNLITELYVEKYGDEVLTLAQGRMQDGDSEPTANEDQDESETLVSAGIVELDGLTANEDDDFVIDEERQDDDEAGVHAQETEGQESPVEVPEVAPIGDDDDADWESGPYVY